MSISAEAAIAANKSILDAINLGEVDWFLENRENYNRADVVKMREEYKKYIAIRLAYPDDTIAISEAVDPYWHAHILFTREYKEACNKLGVEFIDHVPPKEDDISKLKASYLENTLTYYKRHFGQPDPAWWPESGEAAVCSGDGSDGGDGFSWSPPLKLIA